MILSEEEYLEHYGTPRKSGRYPWGSGDAGKQDHKRFLDYVADMRRQGLTEVQIAEGVGITTGQLRAKKTIARNAEKQAQISRAEALKRKGYGSTEGAKKMGIPESTYRTLLAPGAKDKADALQATVQALRDQVAQHTYLDIGSGVENHMAISGTRLSAAVAVLKEEGYQVHPVDIKQVGTNLNTRMKVLVPPGVTQREAWMNRDKIRYPNARTDDGGRSWFGILPPKKIAPDRLGIVYGPDGGDKLDGVIYVRPGVKDVSLGGSRYAQVRVLIGPKHYAKGMAIYSDDMPDGVDLLFHTNKKDSGNKLDALKEITNDPDNPFGAVIDRQVTERMKNGKERVTSAMNIVNGEGSWNKWSRNLSTQMLSKQSPLLARQQLDMTYERRRDELKEILALTNPTVKKKLLESFADSTDSAAVHMKAAALPRQRTQVILPLDSLPEGQIYAPNFNNGERVVLIRYPHGGTFEIPELVVNNKHAPARKLLGDAADAVGINSKVAERLSGADFDGDTVLVIPNGQNRVKTTPALEGLKGFDAKAQYPAYPGMKVMTAQVKQKEMGLISNLITDMTIQKAPPSELARAVRHSMVVIDGEKHKLNWKQSAEDNNIRQLNEKYQGKARGGSSTLISRAGSNARVPERVTRSAAKGGPIDPVTGKLVYEETGRSYINKNGERVQSTTKVKKLALTDDAGTLSSNTPMEREYVKHSNRLKALANEARREYVQVPNLRYSKTAKQVYAPEVASLNASLALAIRNRPLERQAQVLANATIRAKRAEDPYMEKETLKKVKSMALNEARTRTGANKSRVEISAREWEAIQAGAISNSKLKDILDNADLDAVKELATPQTKLLMSSSKKARAQSMLALGYTRAEVAAQLGVSMSTLDRAFTEGEGEG